MAPRPSFDATYHFLCMDDVEKQSSSGGSESIILKMASINKVIIVGNLGADPETRYLPSGDAVTNIRVATTDRYKDKQSGEMREATEWHSISFFGKLAEIAGQYLKKGSQVYVEGSLRTRKYTDKNGVEKYATDIRADSMQMLGTQPRSDDEAKTSRSNPVAMKPPTQADDSDIPF